MLFLVVKIRELHPEADGNYMGFKRIGRNSPLRRDPLKIVVYFQALPELATPQLGQLGPFFLLFARQDHVLRVWQKKVPMMTMMIAMIIMIVMMVILMIMMYKGPKKHTNIMTFQQKCTNFRDFYLVKKGPTNLGIGKPPPPHFRAMPESKRLFSTDVFP